MKDQVKELLLQALEHERGGVRIYQTALSCAVDERLREEWTGYLEETKNHVAVLENVARTAKLDVQTLTPGCEIVQHIGNALVVAMEMAAGAGDPQAAQLVACECVVLAETKDHLNWQLLGKCAEGMSGSTGTALQEAYEEIEDQEDEHLYHSKGWCRELWAQRLGLPAVLPPPEERQHVKTAIGAARAEHASEGRR